MDLEEPSQLPVKKEDAEKKPDEKITESGEEEEVEDHDPIPPWELRLLDDVSSQEDEGSQYEPMSTPESSDSCSSLDEPGEEEKEDEAREKIPSSPEQKEGAEEKEDEEKKAGEMVTAIGAPPAFPAPQGGPPPPFSFFSPWSTPEPPKPRQPLYPEPEGPNLPGRPWETFPRCREDDPLGSAMFEAAKVRSFLSSSYSSSSSLCSSLLVHSFPLLIFLLLT